MASERWCKEIGEILKYFLGCTPVSGNIFMGGGIFCSPKEVVAFFLEYEVLRSIVTINGLAFGRSFGLL